MKGRLFFLSLSIIRLQIVSNYAVQLMRLCPYLKRSKLAELSEYQQAITGEVWLMPAKENGVPCIICMSRLVPQNKIDGIKALGADVRIIGASQDDAQVEVDRLVREEGMTMIPPFDHLDIVAGQGTLGLEMFEALPEMVQVLVPVSGGGLISGIASALKALNEKIKIIGVSMERGAAMYASLHAGKPILVRERATLADSLGGGIGLDNQVTFNISKHLIDDFVLVNEAEIAKAIRHAYWHERQIVEGSGAVCMRH